MNLHRKVGIIGCGHLGLAIAKAIIKSGHDKSLIKVSYRGNPLTRHKIRKENLRECIATNHSICSDSEIFFLTIMPTDIDSLRTPPGFCTFYLPSDYQSLINEQ